MAHLLDAAWFLVKVLSYGGLVVALAGIVVFGWHFVRINARAAQAEANDIPHESWRGKCAIFGYKILVIGVAM